MFSALLEVHPKSEQWDAYLNYAKMHRPELEVVEGFIDNVRYKSLTREGWIVNRPKGRKPRLRQDPRRIRSNATAIATPVPRFMGCTILRERSFSFEFMPIK